MSDHVAEEYALILVALDHDDPERLAAFAHAESCTACARLLQREAGLLALVDGQPVDMTVNPQLKARIMASIDRQEGKRPATRWEPYALAIGALLSVVLALLDLRERGDLFPARAPLCMMWQVLGALFSLAGVGIWARGWAFSSSPLRLAVVAMGGALIGQLWLRVRCQHDDAALHVLVFHVSSFLFATLMGYLLARATWRAER